MDVEQYYLSKTIDFINKRYQEVADFLEQNEKKYTGIKKYTVDYKNELDKYEVYQYQQQLNLIDQRSVLEVESLNKLAYQKRTPYFSKIKFTFIDEQDSEQFYIGRFGLVDEIGMPIIYDWRAPISSLYYDYEKGPAMYTALGKQFKGTLNEKKYFEIIEGELKQVICYEGGLTEAHLLKFLDHTTNRQMRSIIQTIQKEQNSIIREMSAKNLIVQGVAGSGKTSIALHRMAYILYEKREILDVQDVVIISPNNVFSSYISNVLPELGEQSLNQISLDDLMASLLPEKLLFRDRLEEQQLLIERPNDEISRRVLYKRSRSFLKKLEAWVDEIKNENTFYDSILIFQSCLKFFGIQSSEEIYDGIDRYIYLYIKTKCDYYIPNKEIKHILVDEMQDYSLLELSMLNKLFVADKTIVGDILQNIYNQKSYMLADISDIFSNQKTVVLNKSYRSTVEIMAFASRFLSGSNIESVNRHGKKPVILNNPAQSLKAKLSHIIDAFQNSNYQTLGIVVNNLSELRIIQMLFSEEVNYTIYNKHTSRSSDGIILTTTQFAKGLEFDMVCLPLVKSNGLKVKSRRMYVNCSRALHELWVCIDS